MKAIPSAVRPFVLAVAAALAFSAGVCDAQQTTKPATHPAFDLTVVNPETRGLLI